ncbi:GNAT family N-acetyltransferase [Burkholderia vietnamiensis]|uniref:GNAT family N-acetyltransferase n=1 Tax=Burkholderia vietnamiensis TaxID=60552 RepID=UPI00159324B4|nr:GNAT family N-acetyltransferase [Burkholderia vietnamiensis]MCA7946346.1 GNAT family N-acetyltransferase [Burkholderia vietnamiensis]HDR8971458.1 GNAT family N-acetyltransferase [Burkholderia vietnamiensis]HDR9144773.1 GNAT family N-acetyltransferase [Burkholderia vietnamiensis]HDR9218570.1 GNAT family N-acetyltransferase [Burkholderia vietnamiensis]
MSYLITKASLEQSPWLLDEALRLASEDVEFLRFSYPQFDHWFATKVIPGIHDGERTLLLERRGTVTVGILIVKHTAVEKKVCTLRVRPDFESKGLGVRLFQTAFHLLETEQPLLSVSALAAPKFERLFRYFGFAQEAVYQGRYLPHVDEYSYNGLLDPTYTFNDHRANSRDCAVPSIHGRHHLAYRL